MKVGSRAILLTYKERGKTYQELWGGFKEICAAHGISYNYLKARPFPFEYKSKTTGIKYNFTKLHYRMRAPEPMEELFKTLQK